jgi:nitrogen fixation protein FixH
MKTARAWPIAMGTILAIGVAANVWLIRVATADPSFAVEEDYYRKALHWDDEMAQRALNDALAWDLRASPGGIVPDSGAWLRVALRDAHGAHLPDADITVRAFHLARSAAPLDGRLAPDGTGGYGAQLPISRPGLWELRFNVQRGGDRFTAMRRVDLHNEDVPR